MSYNVSRVVVLTIADAWMDSRVVVGLLEAHGRDMPESCFLRGAVERQARASFSQVGDEARVPIVGFDWDGEFSGHAFEDVLLAEIAPKIHGRVEVVFVWAGGDYLSGLRIVDGQCTQHDVVLSLAKAKT